MRHSHARLVLISTAFTTLSACDAYFAEAESSRVIAKYFEESGRKSVDLALAVPLEWDKVCVLGPYSSNAAVRDTLGFDWDAKAKTSISSNDGVSLLLFVRSDQVIQHIEHPRRSGDFSNLTKQCFPRTNAIFIQNERPAKGWPGLFPRK